MDKIKIYLFCKHNLIEWEITQYQNSSVDFVLDGDITLFSKKYTIFFEYEEGAFKFKSTEDFTICYKNEDIDSKFIEDGDIFVCNFLNENSKVVLFVQFEETYGSIFTKYFIKDLKYVKIGSNQYNDIVYDSPNVLDYHVTLKIEGDNAKAIGTAAGAYVNKVKFKETNIKFGDVIFLYGLKCVYLGDYIAINNPNGNVYSKLYVLEQEHVIKSPPRKFLDFKVSAINKDKTYVDLDEEKVVTIDPPNFDVNYSFGFLYFASSIFSLSTFIIVIFGIFFGNSQNINHLVYCGIITVILSIVFYVLSFVLSKKKIKNDEKFYNFYLNDKFKELTLIKDERLRALNQRYPKTIDCYKNVTEFDKSIWERNKSDKKFLTLNIGQGNLYFDNLKLNSDCETKLPEDHAAYKNYLKTINNFKIISKAPITIPLNDISKLAIVSDMDILYSVVENFVVQLSSLHSPEDLKIMFLCSKQSAKKLDYVKQIPHVYSDENSFRYFTSTNEELVDLIYNVKNIISEREKVVLQNPSKKFDTSYVIFVFYDFSNTIDLFLNYIRKIESKINVSFVLVTNDNRNVPDVFKTILDVEDKTQTLYKIQDSGTKKFALTHDYTDVVNLIDIDRFVNSLGRIRFSDGIDSVNGFESKSIFDLYGVDDIGKLDILDRWKKNKLFGMESIPVGVHDREIFSINIHAKHDGPNGIIFGESSSGKTEFLKSFILSYCINFHPNNINFIIFKSKSNYKLNSLSDLSHVVSIIDKESNSEKNRLILLIKNEINKRQALFDSLKVNDINSYLNIYDNFLNMRAIPSLVIVVDDIEKSDLDFVEQLTELFSAMSNLGIYIILSTNDTKLFIENKNILNKFDFKLSFRLADVKDMFEIFDDNDISNLNFTGLFSAKFSNLRVFKNIKVAFSNINYDVKNGSDNLDVVNNCGIVTKKVSKIEYLEQTLTQKDVIVNKILDLSQNIELNKVLVNSPLSYLSLQDLEGYSSNFNGFMWCESKNKCSATIGIIDDPKYQTRRYLEIDFKNSGNLFVSGATASGKSTLIKTLIFSLCCEYKPSDLSLYIADLNTMNDNHYNYAPHIRDIVLNRKDLNGMFKKVLDEFDLRKKIFEGMDISSLESYKLRTGEKLPYVILVIDSIQDIYNGTWDYINFIKMIARDGSAYGIYVCITSSEYGEIETKLAEYFDNKLVLKQNDETLYGKILSGICKPSLKFKGQGVLNYSDFYGDRILEFQVAIPMRCENEVELNNKMRALFIQMNDINNRIYDTSEIKQVLDGEIRHEFYDLDETRILSEGIKR